MRCSSPTTSSESELVIIVTPYVVQLPQPTALRTPVDNFRPATNLDRILLGRQQVAPGGAAAAHASIIMRCATTRRFLSRPCPRALGRPNRAARRAPRPQATTVQYRMNLHRRILPTPQRARSAVAPQKILRAAHLVNLRIEMQGPSRASGGKMTLTRLPSGRRASQRGLDSSMRLPIVATIFCATMAACSELRKCTADFCSLPATSMKTVSGPFTMMSLMESSRSSGSRGPNPIISSVRSCASCA